MERTLLLEGMPNLKVLGKLKKGEDVPQFLQCDQEIKLDAFPDLYAGFAYCEAHVNCVTRDILDRIFASEGEHVDWLEMQFGFIEKVGIENYQQSQI